MEGDVCLLSFDLEHGGEYCGVVQLSAELISLEISEAPNGSVTGNKLESAVKNPTNFNEYVNLGEGVI